MLQLLDYGWHFAPLLDYKYIMNTTRLVNGLTLALICILRIAYHVCVLRGTCLTDQSEDGDQSEDADSSAYAWLIRA